MAGSVVWMSVSFETRMYRRSLGGVPPPIVRNESNDSISGITFHVNHSVVVVIAMILVSTICIMGIISIYLRRCILSEVGRELLFQRAQQSMQNNPSFQGLDVATIASFPVVNFLLMKGISKGKASMECPICLTDFEEHEQFRVLPKCGHAFHINCIDMWLFSHTTCPVCRQSLVSPPEDFLSVQISGEATVALQSILEENLGSPLSLADEDHHQMQTTSESAPTQNEACIHKMDEEKEITSQALSRNSESFRVATKDIERIEKLLSSSARNHSPPPKTKDSRPYATPMRVPSFSKLAEVFKRSPGTDLEDRKQLVDSLPHDISFSFDHNPEIIPASASSFDFQEFISNEDPSHLTQNDRT